MDRLEVVAALRGGGRSRMPGTDFVGADLRDADLSGCELTFVNLAYARLTGANLTDARLNNVVLTSADLCGAVLTGVEASFIEATEANLSSSNGSRSIWRHGNFLRAKFDSANLTEIRFGSCTLESASLADADLSGGGIVDSTCNGASFQSSLLAHIETIGSSFGRSDLSKAKNFWGSRELISEVLWRHIERDDPEAVKLVGAVLLSRHWCYGDWRRYLTTPDMQPYYAKALAIFKLYPDSGAMQALNEGWDWRGRQR